jgi:CelD/BcsL family acetyltransferase involved in cellulose biosynthesis
MLDSGGGPEDRGAPVAHAAGDHTASAWRFTWLRSWKAIWAPEHLANWRATIAGGDEVHATPFMHPDVVRAWLKANGGEAAWLPYFLRASNAGGQTVLWLLVRERGWWRTGLLRRLRPVGGDLFDYHDPIVAPAGRAGDVLVPGFWPALEAELGRHAGDWFDTCSLSRIRPACFGEGRFVAPGGTAALVRLDAYPDFAAYMAARRGSINKLARKQRKLAASGESRLRVYGPSEVDAVLAWLPDLEAAYRARYPDGAVTPAFLSSLVRHGLPSGVVHCSALELDGKPFSWHIGFHLNRVHYDYLCGFDAAYARLSPGLMHVHGLIERLYDASDARVFDFLLGAEAYKADWTDGGEVTVRNAGIRSRALATLPRLYARYGLGVARRAAPAFGRALPAVRGLIGSGQTMPEPGQPGG